MKFLQSLCSQTKTALLHVPPQRCKKDFNHDDFVAWIDNMSKSVPWRSRLSFPNCCIHEEDLHCGLEHCVIIIQYHI